MGLLNLLICKIIVFFLRIKYGWSGILAARPDHVLLIPSHDSGREIKAHVYNPVNRKRPTPVLLNFNGSGFVLPLHGSDDYYCRYISERSDYTVLDIQCRLAPENPFPAALHDIEDVVRYLRARPELYDASRLSIGGFSAGGNLALASATAVLPKGTFRSVIAFYPPVDLVTKPENKTAPDTNGTVITPFIARIYEGSYSQSADRRDPRLSPSFAPVENFPDNVLIVTAAIDYLTVEGEQLALRIEKEGGKYVVAKRFDGCEHWWDKECEEGSDGAKKRDEAYNLVVEILAR